MALLQSPAVEGVAQTLGFAMMIGAAPALDRLANDDGVPPDVWLAGLLRAHLLGAASAMSAGSKQGFAPPSVATVARFLAAELDEMRGEQRPDAMVKL
ncbi:hypothetical protein BH10PSE14_BH10PSE14_04650 [soil metagenome]